MHLARRGEKLSPKSCWFGPAEGHILDAAPTTEMGIPVLLPIVLDSTVSRGTGLLLPINGF
jgi:hypothetical protein